MPKPPTVRLARIPFRLATAVAVAAVTLGALGAATVHRADAAASGAGAFGAVQSVPPDLPDPFVLNATDGDYYVFSTNAGVSPYGFVNIPVLRSPDLEHWDFVPGVPDALPRLGPWAEAAPGLTWAPSVLRTGAGYTLYYAARRRGTTRQCVGRAYSLTPGGPYVDNHATPLVCQLDQGGSIDANAFSAPSAHGSTPYLVWKADTTALDPLAWSGGPHRAATIWSAPLSADGQSIGSATRIFSGGFGWANPLVEGPAMVHRNGYWYLFYSGQRWDTARYAIGWALCAGPSGPCLDATPRAPWKASSATGWGPGGTSFFDDADGNLWMAYHAWTPGRVGYRHDGTGGSRSLHLEMVGFRNALPVASPRARDVAANPRGGYYVLDSAGEVRAYGGAPSYGSPSFGGDLARSIAVMPDGKGYVVADSHGAVHRYGSATGLPPSPTPWPGSDQTRDIVITPTGRGYALLDSWGGVHATGDAPHLPASGYWKGWDIARGLAITPGNQGYLVLDGWGGVHPSGDARNLGASYTQGSDIARAIVMSPTGGGYAVVDGLGGVHSFGDAPLLRSPTGPPADRWVGAALAADGTWVAVRRDGVNAVWSSNLTTAPASH